MTTLIDLSEHKEKRKEIIEKVRSDLVLRKMSRLSPITTNVIMYELCDSELIIPFYYSYKLFNQFPNDDNFPEMKAEFTGSLLTRQTEILPDVHKILQEQRCVLLSLYCGFGKTIFAIKLACDLMNENIGGTGGRVLICCHRIILMEQWKESIHKFTNGKCQILTATNEAKKDAQFYVINIQNIQKREIEDFDSVSILIIDECHTICTQNLVRSLMFVRPKYCIGLSATPDRDDGLQVVLNHFFGEQIVYKPLSRLYTTYIFDSGFKPVPRKNDNDKLDWNDLLKQQAEDQTRNLKICQIAKYFSTRNILILCKRVAHAQILCEELQKTEEVDVFTGTSKSFNSEARILIVTCSKGGVGFDHPKLDMLIVAADVENLFIQYLGRVFRRDDSIPIVVDVKDKFPSFQQHLRTRKDVYEQTGSIIYDFKKSFPDFNM